MQGFFFYIDFVTYLLVTMITSWAILDISFIPKYINLRKIGWKQEDKLIELEFPKHFTTFTNCFKSYISKYGKTTAIYYNYKQLVNALLTSLAWNSFVMAKKVSVASVDPICSPYKITIKIQTWCFKKRCRLQNVS